MAAEDFATLLNSLTPQEQDAIREFIQFLKARKKASQSPFLAAVEEFVDQHPELLRRLAQ
jgi:hypothetical protein